jgi:hypothetical protein
VSQGKKNSESMPSTRSFGLLFTLVFAALASYAFFMDWRRAIYVAAASLSAITIVVTLFAPNLLSPFNRAWFLLGEMLGKIVSPVVLGIIFFGLLTPVGFITRLFGRDELRLKKAEASSHWVERKPAGPSPESFNNQF